jgi:class 3 adenylate cyclase
MAEDLYEREAEVSALRALLSEARAGHGRLAVIEGPPGIGKTTLARQLAAEAAQAGMRTLTARGGELEAELPFGIVRQLFETAVARADEDARAVLLSGSAAPAAAALGLAPAASPDVFGALNGLYWLAANLAAEQPLALIVDDVQWSDPPSLRFLSFIARRLEDLPLFVLAASRPAPDDGLVHDLLADPVAETVHPALLSEGAVRALVRERLDPYADEAFGAACAEVTGGNPFLVTELLRACERDGIRPDATGTARVRELGPRAISRAVLLRLRGLSESARAVAQAVAVLGSKVPVPRAAALAGLTPAEASTAADDLIACGVLSDERPLSYLHPVLRNAVYQDIPPAARSQRHAQAAERLGHEHAPLDEIVAHLVLTEPAGDPAIIDRLLGAGYDALSRGAADSSLRTFARALAEPPPPERHDEVVLAYGTGAVVAGAHAEAVEHLRALLERTPDPLARARIAMLVIPAMAYSGRAPEADELTDRLVAELEPVDSELALSVDAHERFSRSDREQADRLIRHRDRPGSTPGERLVLARASHNLALTLDADVHETLDLVARALPEPEALVIDSPLMGTCTFEVLWALRLCDRPELTRRLGDAIADAIRAGGYEYPFVFQLSWAAEIALREGRLGDAADAAERGLAIAARYPFGVVPGHRAKGFLVLARIERGDVEGAVRAWEEIDVGPNFMGMYGELGHVEAELALARGQREMAAEAYAAFGAACEAHGRLNPSYWPWRARLAPVLAQLGREEEARTLVEEGLERARRFGAPAPIGILLRAQARLGDGDPGVLAEADALLRDSPARLEHARLLVDLGGAMRRGGQPSDARGVLREALDLAVACGAEALAETARGELRAAGGRLHRERLSGTDALTPSEGRIAGLAARGVTNREIAQTLFLSVRTVEMHLGNAYRKLDIRSRAELPAALGGGDVDEPSASRDAARAAAPDGTVTILFSDVEGSTALVERLGDQRWLEILRRHNELFRRHIAQTGGFEVKTVGDAFMVAFPSARGAVRCAAAIQRDMGQTDVGHGPLRVRMGMHVGDAIAEDSDYHGRTVIVASRIAGAARGGEVLASALVRELVGDVDGVAFGPPRPLSLKGLRATTTVHAVVW